jgi:NitT/TauT family transport system substrate-binding protein
MSSRRAFLASAAAIGSSFAVGCRSAAGAPGVVRVGVMANLTHGPFLAAIASGGLQRALERSHPGTKIEVRTFRAGPRVCEALLGGAIDVGTTGPGPVVSMHARHHDRPLEILSGVCSGGASMVVLPWVNGPRDLAGKQVATPQIGSTQDVSLRTWMAANGLRAKEHGGDVHVNALASANIFDEMRRGTIAAGWLPEPWATRVVLEMDAKRLFDERDLWPEGRFPTAIVVGRSGFLARRRDEARAVVAAIDEQIGRAKSDPIDLRDLVFSEIKRITHKGLSKPAIEESWRRVDFLADPQRDAIAKMARDARALGYVPTDEVATLFG